MKGMSDMNLQRPYINTAAILLLAGVALGCLATLAFPATAQSLFAVVFETISELGETIFLDQGGLQGTVTLFWHNFRAAMGMAVMGVALGVYPLLGIVLNGVIVGVVMAFSLLEGQILVFFAGVLPHGVFEIPALIITAGVGLHLGWGPMRKNWVGYRQALRSAVDPLLLAGALLVIAAFVEVSITPLLLSSILR